MKKCPQCQSVYTDDSLSFCLSDGTPLLADFDAEKFNESEKTIQFPAPVPTREVFRPTSPETIPQSAVKTEIFQTTGGRVSKVWIFSTIGLFGLIIIGLIGFSWFVFGPGSSEINTERNQNSIQPENSPVQTARPDSNRVDQTTPPSPTPTAEPAPTTYRVVGVQSNDVLYIRPAPGNLKSFLGKIPPDGRAIIVTGGGRRVGKSTWYPVSYKGIRGWVNGRFIKKE